MILTFTGEEDFFSGYETNTSQISDISSIQRDHSEISTTENNFYFEVVYPEIFSEKSKSLDEEIFLEKLEENEEKLIDLKALNFLVDVECTSFENSWLAPNDEDLLCKKDEINDAKTSLKIESKILFKSNLVEDLSFEEEKIIILNNSLAANKSTGATQGSKNYIPKKDFCSSPVKRIISEYPPQENHNVIYGANIFNYYNITNSNNIISNLNEASENTRQSSNMTTNLKNKTQEKIQLPISQTSSKDILNHKCSCKVNNNTSTILTITKENFPPKYNIQEEQYLENFFPADLFNSGEVNKSNIKLDETQNPPKTSRMSDYKNCVNNQMFNYTITQQASMINNYNNDTSDSMISNSQANPSQNYVNNQNLICYPNSSRNIKLQHPNMMNQETATRTYMNTNTFPVNFSNMANYSQTLPELKITNTNSHKTTPFNLNLGNNIALNFPLYDEEKLLKSSIFLARDQTGCRLLQKKIDSNPSWGTEKVFPMIFQNGVLLDLILDPFGNYLIQKLICYLVVKDLETFINCITPDFYDIGINIHGTRVLQKFVERLENPKLYKLFTKVMQPYIFDFMKDVNGSHIIIKISSTLKSFNNQALYECIDENLIDLATNKHSCSTFQKCLDNAQPELKEKLVDKIVDNTFILMCDQYGNYVLQFVISMNNHDVNFKISTFFRNKISYLARQKFSSNALEKLFNYCDEQTKLIMIKEICNPKITVELLLDNCGNYVLQQALTYAIEPHRAILLNSIAPHLEKLQNLQFGGKFYGKILSICPELKFCQIGVSSYNSNVKVMNNNLLNYNQYTCTPQNYYPVNKVNPQIGQSNLNCYNNTAYPTNNVLSNNYNFGVANKGNLINMNANSNYYNPQINYQTQPQFNNNKVDYQINRNKNLFLNNK